MTKQIAWLGLGAMGQRMAKRLLAHNFSMVLYNRSPAPLDDYSLLHTKVSDSAAQAAASASIVISMVSDEAASRAVWQAEQGALNTLREGAVAVECSTLPISWIRELKTLVNAKGALFVHAPVIGSLTQAESGTLQVLLGCENAISEALNAIFNALCSHIHLMNSPEQAALLKLCANGWLAAQTVSASEAIRLAESYGLSRKESAEFLARLPMAGSSISAMLNLIAQADTAPRFPIRLMSKDLDYLLAAAQTAEKSNVMALCRELFRRAFEDGQGEKNITAIIDAIHVY